MYYPFFLFCLSEAMTFDIDSIINTSICLFIILFTYFQFLIDSIS